MLIQGLIFRACGIGGQVYKTPLCSRLRTPLYQQCAEVKSIESRLGLPEKPKKPLSVFFRFARTIRPKLVAENPGVPSKEISKILGAEWKKCDEALKRQFEELAQKDIADYAVELEKYRLSLSKEDIESIKAAKAKRRERKAVKEQKQKLKKLNKPKKPPNAYIIFVEDLLAKGDYKDMTFAEKSRKFGALWKEASEETVAKYREKAAEAQKKYKEEHDAWEERMVALGYIDVIYETESKGKKEA